MSDHQPCERSVHGAASETRWASRVTRSWWRMDSTGRHSSHLSLIHLSARPALCSTSHSPPPPPPCRSRPPTTRRQRRSSPRPVEPNTHCCVSSIAEPGGAGRHACMCVLWNLDSSGLADAAAPVRCALVLSACSLPSQRRTAASRSTDGDWSDARDPLQVQRTWMSKTTADRRLQAAAIGIRGAAPPLSLLTPCRPVV